jgi:hypothetical protein
MTMPPGWREIGDPEAEIRRLAGERAALETVRLPRRDLDVLLAATAAYLSSLDEGVLVSIPGELTYQDVEDVVKRHGRRY